MTKHIIVLFLLVGPMWVSAQTTVMTVDSSGNVVTPNGSVSSTAFNASGGGAGRLSLGAGPDVMQLTNAFELLAPFGLTPSYQEIAPLAPAMGLWRSNYSPASITTSISGGGAIQYTIGSGGTYSEAPACWIVYVPITGSVPTCSVTLTGNTIASGGIAIVQTGTYSSATIYLSNTSQIAFAELSGDASTSGSNIVTGLGMYGSGAASTADQMLVTTATGPPITAAWKSQTNPANASQFLTYSTSTHNFAYATASLDVIASPNAAKIFSLGNAHFLQFGDSSSSSTGSNNLVTMTDGSSNVGTGSVLFVKSLSTSAIPLTVTAGGTANGIQVSTSGVLAKFGSGSVNADECNTATCGTVTSVTFTGDGVVDSSTPSAAVTTSGTVAATLLPQSAFTVFGNFTSGSANPSFSNAPSIGPFITFNGSTSGSQPFGCVPTATCTSLGSTTVKAAFVNYNTATNCVTNGSCGSATAGMAAILTTGATVVVSTSSVTANSEIKIQYDETLGGSSQLNVICNTGTSEGATYWVSSRTPGSSFTIKTSVTPVTHPACVSWTLNN
jgi:hypothetical protein